MAMSLILVVLLQRSLLLRHLPRPRLLSPRLTVQEPLQFLPPQVAL